MENGYLRKNIGKFIRCFFTNPADNSLVAKVPSMGKTETNEAIQF